MDTHRWSVVEASHPEVPGDQPLVVLKGLSPATRYALYVSTVNTRSTIITATTRLFSEYLFWSVLAALPRNWELVNHVLFTRSEMVLFQLAFDLRKSFLLCDRH